MIALDDQAKYPASVLAPPEFEVLLGEREGDCPLDKIEQLVRFRVLSFSPFQSVMEERTWKGPFAYF